MHAQSLRLSGSNRCRKAVQRLLAPALVLGSTLQSRSWALAGHGCSGWPSSLRIPRRSIAGFIPVPPPQHPDHPVVDMKPFAEQNGGVDEDMSPPPRLYSHGPCG
eukprot:6228585-Amphidinium_carterae.1